MKLLVADDHALVREGLIRTLGHLAENVEVFEAENGNQVKSFLEKDKALDLILLDLYMPETNGFELVSYVCNTCPDVPLVVLSASSEPENMRQVLDRGACGYITKSTDCKVMLGALRLVISGGVYIPPDMVESGKRGSALTTSTNVKQSDIESKLTSRQLDVLKLLAKGDSNKVIAYKLNLSEHTVKIHMTAIFKALKVSNRTQALLAAQRILNR